MLDGGYLVEDAEMQNAVVDQCIIGRQKYLETVRNFPESSTTFLRSKDWFPLVNSYYQFSEDYDAANRVPHRVHDRSKSNSAETKTYGVSLNDGYLEKEVHGKFLHTNPTSFMIFGKPDVGGSALGELLADYWRSVLITPKTLIEEEIRSDSQLGQCIEFNLRCGRSIKPDLVMDLLGKRFRSTDVLNRGFVLTGFPLIANDFFQEDWNTHESALFTAQDVFNDILDGVCDKNDASQAGTEYEQSDRQIAMDVNISELSFNAPSLDDSSTSRVPVPDDRFDYLCDYFKPVSKVPAFLNIVDIAGLVKGASEGQGLGNAFLSHISACDALFHLCRAFEDDDVTHIEGDVNPVRDLEIIGEELRLKDEEALMKKLDGLEKTVVRGGDKKLKPEYDTLVKIKGVLVDEKKHIRFHDWNANDIEVLNKYLFLTSKPAIYLVNLSEKDYIKKKNKWLVKIKEWIDKNDPGSIIIPFSGALESKLVEMDEPSRKKYLEDNNTTSALDKIIVQGYKALHLEYFFTSGPDEVKAWTIQKGTKAPQAAGRIHTDFEKGFIMAEVMKFADFKEEGSEAATKAAGKYRQQGRNYVVEDGDIIFFKFNAGAGLKDAKKK